MKRIIYLIIILLLPIIFWMPTTSAASCINPQNCISSSSSLDYSNPMTTSTIAGTSSTFSVVWTDNSGIVSYTPYYDNGGGSLAVQPTVTCNSTTCQASMTQTLPQVGSLVRWSFSATDKNSLLNSTVTYCMIVGGNPSNLNFSSSYLVITDACYDILAYSNGLLYNLVNTPSFALPGSAVGYHEFHWNPQLTSGIVTGYSNIIASFTPPNTVTFIPDGLTYTNDIVSSAWSPDGSYIMIASSQALLRYNVGNQMASIITYGNFNRVRLSIDGTFFLAVGLAGVISYNPNNGQITNISSSTFTGEAFTSYQSPQACLVFCGATYPSALLIGGGSRYGIFYSSNNTINTFTTNLLIPTPQEVGYSRDFAYALITIQHNTESDVAAYVPTVGFSWINTPSTANFQNNTANEIAFSPDNTYAYVTTTAGGIIKINYASTKGTFIPISLSPIQLRGIEFRATNPFILIQNNSNYFWPIVTGIAVALVIPSLILKRRVIRRKLH